MSPKRGDDKDAPEEAKGDKGGAERRMNIEPECKKYRNRL